MIYSKLIHWIKVLYLDYSLKLPKVSYSFFFFFAKNFHLQMCQIISNRLQSDVSSKSRWKLVKTCQLNYWEKFCELLLFLCVYVALLYYYYYCKDWIWDGPKLGLDFSSMSPNNEFKDKK